MPSKDIKVAGSMGLQVVKPATTVAIGSYIQGSCMHDVLDRKLIVRAFLLRAFDSDNFTAFRFGDKKYSKSCQ